MLKLFMTRNLIHTLPISEADAVVNEGAVVIKILDASVAYTAVLGPQWSQASARVAQSGQHNVSLLPFVVIWNLPNKALVNG